MAEDYAPPAFRSLPQPENRRGTVRAFQRHRILSDDQFGSVTVPEPLRRFIPEGGEAWMGRPAQS